VITGLAIVCPQRTLERNGGGCALASIEVADATRESRSNLDQKPLARKIHANDVVGKEIVAD
jgi:hypothetical protein